MGLRWHLAVLIPARNEEGLLPRCLRSIQAARKLLPPHVTSDVVVVADCCTDATHALARAMLGAEGLAIAADAGQVGSARALAAKAALRRMPALTNACWLANTDADSLVPEDWLLRHLLAAQTGVAALAGVVGVDSFDEHRQHVAERFRLTYLIHPDGTHPHVHGANLGIRADAYLHAGGWSDLATAEDHDLWARVQRAGYLCASDAAVRVLTSGRRVGRAPAGFAGALAAHNEVAL